MREEKRKHNFKPRTNKKQLTKIVNRIRERESEYKNRKWKNKKERKKAQIQAKIHRLIEYEYNNECIRAHHIDRKIDRKLIFFVHL